MDLFDLRPGLTIDDRFEIVCLTGSGGAGVVFRALDRTTGSPVALKVLPPESAPGGAERLQREAQLLATLRHPRVVSYITHGRTLEDRIFLVMEWLEGEDLRRVLSRQPLSLAEGLGLVRAVAEGLAAVHRRGIVHRDIKPSNLFLREGRADRPMLIDFGLARGQGVGMSLTQTGQVFGTLCYMAPEQVRGERDVGPSADVFALGCVLYECLSGQALFGGQSSIDALARFSLERPPPMLQSWLEGVPAGLAELLRRMLAQDPAARPSDGGALCDALEALAPDLLAEAESVGSLPLFVSAQEQQLLTFIVALPHALLEDPEAVAAAPGGQEDPRWPEVEALMALFRARLNLLGNGIFVVSLNRTDLAAADQAGTMARLVLVLKERLSDWALAATTVRSAIVGGPPAGHALWVGGDVLRAGWCEEARRGAQGQGGKVVGEASQVWLDELTAQLLDTRFQVRWVKDKVYVLEAERSAPDQQRPLLGRPTPCVGREHELLFLDAILTAVREDTVARAVLVLAPPGQGKSRLRHEFLRRLKASEQAAEPAMEQASGQASEKTGKQVVEVLFGRADLVRAGLPRGLLGGALLGLCGLTEAAGGLPEEVGRRQARFRERIGRHVSDVLRLQVVEFLGELCGVPFADEKSPRLRAARQEPRLMSGQLEGAWVEFLRAECAVRPVLLVLEDLHWSDAATVRLVDVALRELADRPLMVLALGRPDVKEMFPHLWEGRSVQELRLGGLSRRAGAQLIREALGERATAEVVERVLHQAGGNALFLEELIRAVAAVTEGAEAELPETVLAMIEARFWRLDPEARRILRVASLFGQTFWRGGVVEFLGGEERVGDELDRWLRILVTEELIVPHPMTRYAGDPEFGFRSALLREAALGLFEENDRVMGHRLAAEYLERQGESEPLVLADHYERGELRERAARLYAQAAIQALGQSGFDASLRCVGRGVACGAEGEVLGLLRSTEAWVRFWRLELPAAYAASCAALAVLPERCVPLYMALGVAVASAWSLGEREAMDAALGRLAEGDPPPAARSAFLESAAIAGSILAILGRRQDMAVLLERMERATERLGDNETRNRGLVALVRANWQLHLGGELWELRRTAEAGVMAFAATGDGRMQGFIELALGYALLQLGDYEAAWTPLRQSIARLEGLRELLGVAVARAHLALGLIELSTQSGQDAPGRAAQVAEARRQGESILGLGLVGYLDGLAHAIMAKVLLVEGAWGAAEEEIRRALGCSVEAPVLQPLMLATQVEILLGENKYAEAVGVAREGLGRLAQLGGSCWYDTRLYLTAADAYLRVGQPEEAQQAVAAARRLIERRAAQIPDAAARERYLTMVPHNARVLELARSAA